MHLAGWLFGLLLALVWVHRLVDAALGMPTLTDVSKPEWDVHAGADGKSPRVTVVVPARNEEDNIGPTLESLLRLDYINYEVIAVDDRSSDATGRIMDEIAAKAGPASPLKIVHITDLPPRWLGKTHAMYTAAQQGSGEWILFTDADVVFRADSLRRAMAYVMRAGVDHIVLTPTMDMRSWGERLMIGFFQALFAFGHRPWKVNDPKTKDHMGVGAFNLVRRSVYHSVGTYERLRLEVIDDMKLGKMVKEHGFRQQVVIGLDLISLHWANGAMGVVRNLTKNFFALMNFKLPKAIGATFLLLVLNLGPFLGLAFCPGIMRVPYGIAVAVIALLYTGMSWHSKIPPYYFVLHPVSTLLFAYTMLRSTFLTLWRGGVVWRGTKYPLAELRKGLV